MIYGSVCSGIEAATQAWHPLGWTPAFFSEIDKFPSAVLAHHYGSNMPDEPPAANGVPNYGDMTEFERWPDHAIDILVGGTPCQSFSVAGLRAGLADPRGDLMLTFGAVAQRYKPKWIVWENVVGVLSSNGGRDFGTFLRLLGICGYGFAYRVLDAQFVRVDGFGRAVPQRRRRVFVVGCLGDWRRAAAVLSEPEGLSGNPAPCRKAGKVAPTIPARRTGGGGLGTDFDCDGGLIADKPHTLTSGMHKSASRMPHEQGALIPEVANPLTACMAKGFNTTLDEGQTPVAFSSKDHGQDAAAGVSPTLRAGSHDASHANAGVPPAVAFKPSHFTRGKDGAPSEVYPPLSADADKGDQDPVILSQSFGFEPRDRGDDGRGYDRPPSFSEGVAPTMGTVKPPAAAYDLRGREGGAQFEGPHDTANVRAASGGSSRSYVAQTWAVRRLTPRECERLQGFPDDHTRIPWRKKAELDCPDGPRYKALGNSMAVNCMRWIGTRIQMVENLCEDLGI